MGIALLTGALLGGGGELDAEVTDRQGAANQNAASVTDDAFIIREFRPA